MAEVRGALDALDEQIVTLLGRRMRYVEAAGRIKQRRDEVRDEARNAVVIAHAAEVAERVDFPPEVARELYRMLIEASIAHELERFDAAE
jgi:isochorismate pyruvate lyase